MKMPYKLLIFCLALGLTASVSAQDRKDIRDRGIVSRTVNEYFIEEGIKEPLIESFQRYNKDGEVIELKEFNKRGEITRWEKYAYDEDRNLIEEQFLDEKGKVTETEKNIYKDGLRVEKQYFNDRNKLYKKKVYVYE
jgi:hypothetical protein